MIEFFTRKEFAEAADFIRSHTEHEPTIGLILGTGLNPLAEEVQRANVIPYRDIPHFPVSTVEGHVGQLVIGELEGQEVLIMQGRAHYYEGYSPQHICLPIRVMQLLGINILIVTNAAGGLNPAFKAGDLMLITDHINLIGMAGLNPLRGPDDPELGPRFPEMSQAYDLELREMALQVADDLGFPLHQGVYICLAGPSFETPADLKFLRIIGADAVGMSTVPEVTVARHAGMRVLGISGISNVAIIEPTEERKATHEEVLEAGKLLVPKLTALLKGVVSLLANGGL
ncbi:MAG: purine-nucleoside phosphorylase [Chloroflexi bacterium]|nr:purine-nucleoside phosphorylase [Chloroflexota bacterium]